MVQPLRAADVPAAIALLERAGLPSGAANIARYVHWQPDGAWGVVEHGSLVGMVTLLQFGHVGFVGCMAVEPDRQARGIGRALLEHAQGVARRAGVITLLLEATPSGQRLYERLGYVVAHETWILSRSRVAPSDPVGLDHERRAIFELDRGATGSPRDVMIGGLIDEGRGGVERTGALDGYGLVVGDRLGPVIARDPGAGRALVDRLAGACTVAAVPAPNEPAMAAFAANGFGYTRSLRRMRLGPPVAANPAWLWSLASSGAG
jgi:GNAT superfamily N-acetyltransferase